MTKLRDAGFHDEIEETAHFWLPERYGERASGRLTYKSGELIRAWIGGTLGLDDAFFLGLGAEHITIHAHIVGGGDVTLLGCLLDLDVSTSAGATCKLRADTLLVGGHYLTENEVIPSKSKLSLTGLNEWFDYEHFRAPSLARTNPTVVTGDEASVQFSHRVVAIDATVGSDLSTSMSMTRVDGFQMAHQMWLWIEPTSPQPLAWHETQAWRLKHLQSLLFGAATSFNELVLFDPRPEPISHDQPSTRSIRYLRPQLGDASPRRAWAGAAFPFPLVENRLETIINKWYDFCERSDDVANLFFACMLNETRLAPELLFLSYLQVLEGLMRTTQDGQFIDPSAYIAIRDSLLNAIPADTPPDLKTALKKRLEYGNERSLRKRMRDTLRSLHPRARALILGRWEARLADYVDKLVDGRNYLTHYDPSGAALRLSQPELAVAASRLRCLCALLLLRICGLDDEVIEERFRETYSFVPSRSSATLRDPASRAE